jgi:hypothetical protein
MYALASFVHYADTGHLQKVFCEDFGASWSLAMLVDAHDHIELVEEDGSTLSRGLIAQGFYEVGEITLILYTMLIMRTTVHISTYYAPFKSRAPPNT